MSSKTLKEVSLESLIESLFICWDRSKLMENLNHLEKMELEESETLTPKEYKLYTLAYGICKQKLFNLPACYRENTGRILNNAISAVTDKRVFQEVVEDFKETFKPDVTVPETVEIYKEVLNSLEFHLNNRI